MMVFTCVDDFGIFICHSKKNFKVKKNDQLTNVSNQIVHMEVFFIHLIVGRDS